MPRYQLMLRVASFLVLPLFLAGCPALFPKTATLHSVHEAYRTDFDNVFLQASGSTEKCKAQSESGKASVFAKTFHQIQLAKSELPAGSAERAHILVLEAMVYLQAGLRSTAASKVKALSNISLRSATGDDTRDGLFLQALPGLVAGWDVYCKITETITGPGQTYRNDDVVESHADELKDPDAIKAFDLGLLKSIAVLQARADDLREVVLKDGKRISTTDVKVDDGAIYLATTAAMFDYMAVRRAIDTCDAVAYTIYRDGTDAHCYKMATASQGDPSTSWQVTRLKTAACGIWEFLYEGEKKVDPDTNAPAPNLALTTPARVRYVGWYIRLHDEVEKRTEELKRTGKSWSCSPDTETG